MEKGEEFDRIMESAEKPLRPRSDLKRSAAELTPDQTSAYRKTAKNISGVVKKLEYDEDEEEEKVEYDSDEDSDEESYPKYESGLTRLLNLAPSKKAFHKQYWTKEEDEKLQALVNKYGAKNWKRIASYFETRTDVQ